MVDKNTNVAIIILRNRFPKKIKLLITRRLTAKSEYNKKFLGMKYFS